MKYLLIALVLIGTNFAMAQQTTPKTAFLEKWENAKNYTLELAEAMPEDAFGFKPSERQMSFKEQLIHIKANMDWLSTTYFKGTEPKAVTDTKANIIKSLEASFDGVAAAVAATDPETFAETVDFFAGPKSKLQILNLLQDHLTHHRGQLIVYLNLKQVAPPRYVGW
ncbi:DinB family protein [Gilvibacter sp. SZ-19]|uniref:DinB family protein n=1 Tax=unclassified Gilvibacter TaxID=2625242 RepID=UPI000B3BDEA3|nr:DinB family protein [Gilvibacter sp. SZ-19]ARV11785.1 DinB family protein [Gilvibacter sp. SZ-19]